MTDTTTNITLAQCLKETSDFGKTTVINICSGETHIVPWGSADWVWAGIAIFGAVVTVSLVAVLGYSLFRMVRDS